MSFSFFFCLLASSIERSLRAWKIWLLAHRTGVPPTLFFPFITCFLKHVCAGGVDGWTNGPNPVYIAYSSATIPPSFLPSFLLEFCSNIALLPAELMVIMIEEGQVGTGISMCPFFL